MYTSVHDSLDQGPQILVLHSSLHLNEAAPVTAILHGLVLQITLPTLITNWAVKRMVDLQNKAKSGVVQSSNGRLHLHRTSGNQGDE
jgi:hypothetical protein